MDNLDNFRPDDCGREEPEVGGGGFDITRDTLFRAISGPNRANVERLELELELEAKRGLELIQPGPEKLAEIERIMGKTRAAQAKAKTGALLLHAMKVGMIVFIECELAEIIRVGFADRMPEEMREALSKIIEERRRLRRLTA